MTCMTEYDVPIPPGADLTAAVARIEACCLTAGLRLTQKGTLARYPGCVHWHFKQGGASGTLEITLWPATRRLWFALRPGRAAPWVTAIIPELSATLIHSLAE